MSEVLHVKFQGVEEGDDPRAQPPGAILVAENHAMDKARRLVKRAGTSFLTKGILGGGELAGGKRLQTRGHDLVVEDGEFAISYSPALTRWHKLGRPSPLRMTQRALVDSTRSAIAADVAIFGRVILTASLSGVVRESPSAYGSTLTLSVEDIETGAKILSTVVTPSAAWARVHVTDSGILLTYSRADTSQVIVEKYDLVNFSRVGSLQLDNAAGGAIAASPCDSAVAYVGGVETIYVAWYVNSAPTLKVAAVRAADLSIVSGPVRRNGISVSGSYLAALSVAVTTAGVHVLASSAGTTSPTYFTKLDRGTLALLGQTEMWVAPRTLSVSVKEFDSTRLLVCCTCGDTNFIANRFQSFLVSKLEHEVDETTNRITWHAMSMGSPWTMGGRWFAPITLAPMLNNVTRSIPNASSVIVELDFIEESPDPRLRRRDGPHTHVGTMQATTAGWNSYFHYVPQTARDSDGACYVPAAYRNRETPTLAAIPIGWNLHKIGLASEDAHRLAVVGRGGLAAAGAPYWLDGNSVYPYGFAHAPVIACEAVAGDGSVLTGTYQYIALFEWRDANGVLHRSMPSPPQMVEVVATGKILIRVATSSLSNKQGPDDTNGALVDNPVSIALYRTTSGDQTYHRLTLEPEFQILLNNPRVAFVELVDRRADADITTGLPARPLGAQPQLYTATGELEDVPPPSFVTCVTHRGRLVGIDGTLRTVWFSKDSTEDPTVAPGFHEQLTHTFASDKTALASLDETLVVFGPEGIDLVYGAGADATGLGAWEVARIQTDVGCINPRSIVTTPMGVAFQSQRGIELFDRGKNVSWVGKAVEETLRAYPEVTSATLVADAHEVRWTCNQRGGEVWAGVVLAYDYVNKIWFTRKYQDVADTGVSRVCFSDAALVGGVYHLLTYNGQVYHETTEHKLDGDEAYVETDLRMAPMSPAGNMAWHRIKDVSVLGESVATHRLEISVRRDYASDWQQTKVFEVPATSLEKCRVTLKHQKCRAVEVQIRDLEPDSWEDGEGVILNGLAFRVGVNRGVAKTSAKEQG